MKNLLKNLSPITDFEQGFCDEYLFEHGVQEIRIETEDEELHGSDAIYYCLNEERMDELLVICFKDVNGITHYGVKKEKPLLSYSTYFEYDWEVIDRNVLFEKYLEDSRILAEQFRRDDHNYGMYLKNDQLLKG